jgi:hypothetical protein
MDLVDVHQFFPCDWNEDGLIVTKWMMPEENSSDIFTKNVYGPMFEKQFKTFVGNEKYLQC